MVIRIWIENYILLANSWKFLIHETKLLVADFNARAIHNFKNKCIVA